MQNAASFKALSSNPVWAPPRSAVPTPGLTAPAAEAPATAPERAEPLKALGMTLMMTSIAIGVLLLSWGFVLAALWGVRSLFFS